ncbi:hypothetical protein AB0383_10805 [Amycolatopsis sp. NPDC051373]|uniref:hypothetical protein n=1 Tax=Amycolatopsis sp. NPDC051373 TaxID=3155801 RepID=UPI00344DC1B8
MADNPNNNNGFQQDDDGIWPDSSSNGKSNTTGDPGKDFDGLTWKQIEAAILGGGSMTGGQDNLDRAYGNVNWQSLQAAAGVFQTTQLNLAAISQAIKDQTAALAGDDGPWKGTAADNFKVLAANLSGKFDALVHMITDGGGGARDIPTQLVNSAAYLQWAQNTLRYIDSYYAEQVIARGKVLGDGRAFISQFPDAVEMMTNDMRQVGNQLAGKYNTVATSSYSPPPPGQAPPPPPPNVPPPGGGDDNLPPPPNIPPPADIPPPGGGAGGGDGGGGAGNVPPPNIPPPPGDTGGGDGTGGAGNPPPLNAAAIPPPPGDVGGGDGGAGDPPPFRNLDVAPPNLDTSGGGGPGGGAGLSNFDTTPPPLTSPNLPPPPGSIGGDDGGQNGGQNGGLGNLPPFTSPNLTPPPGSTGSNNGAGNGGTNLANIKPPALTPPPGDVKGGGGLGDLGNTGGPGSTGGGGGLGDIKPPALTPPPDNAGLGNNLSSNALNPSDLPPGLQDGSNNGNQGAIPPPSMMPPPTGAGGAGGLGNQGSDRPDSAGLLGGVDKPWLSDIPKGIGDPTSLGETPPLSHASWAPPPGDAGGTGGAGGADLDGAGGLGGAGSDGPGGIKGLDSSNLVPPPDLPQSLADPNGTNGPGQVGAGGAGSGMPMMPPGGAGGGASGLGNQGSERPDSAGLLGGIDKPWLTDVPQGIGDPTSFGETPPLKSASWAPPPGADASISGAGDLGGAGDSGGLDGVKGLDSSNLVPPPDLPQSLADPNGTNGPGQVGAGGAGSGMPMMPPGGAGGGAGANAPAADRPDSAGLLGGVDNAWLANSPAGVGDPNSFGDTPPSKSADWAPPALSSVDSIDAPATHHVDNTGTPGMAVPPQNGMGGPAPAGTATDRPDSASLLDATTQPWTNGQVPASAGDPAVVSDTPAAPATSWSTQPDPVPAAPVPVAVTPVTPVPVDATPAHPTPVDPTPVEAAPAETVTPATPDDLAPVTGWGTGDQPPAGSGGWATSAVPAVPVVVPPVQAGWGVAGSAATPATPATQSAQNTQNSEQYNDKHDDREGAIAGGVGGGEPDEVRIAVVQAAEVVDTSAWDAGTADFLPGLLPSSVFAQREEREEDFVTDLVERSDKPWRPAGGTEDSPHLATYQRVRTGQGEFYADELPTNGGPDPDELESEEDTAEVEEGEEEEEAERTMADLLSQDESAWGRPASRPSGVLE